MGNAGCECNCFVGIRPGCMCCGAQWASARRKGRHPAQRRRRGERISYPRLILRSRRRRRLEGWGGHMVRDARLRYCFGGLLTMRPSEAGNLPPCPGSRSSPAGRAASTARRSTTRSRAALLTAAGARKAAGRRICPSRPGCWRNIRICARRRRAIRRSAPNGTCATADACLILVDAGGVAVSGGTALAEKLAARYGKPLKVVDVGAADAGAPSARVARRAAGGA